jgi:hypothetical protein
MIFGTDYASATSVGENLKTDFAGSLQKRPARGLLTNRAETLPVISARSIGALDL